MVLKNQVAENEQMFEALETSLGNLGVYHKI